MSAAASLAMGAVLLLPAGDVPAASPPVVHQAISAVAAPPAPSQASQAATFTSAPADDGTAPVIRVKTVRVDPEGVEVQEQRPASEARQPETGMVDPSTPGVGAEPAAASPRRETHRASAVPTRITSSARTTRRVASSRRFATRKARQLADEARASDGALSYAPRPPQLGLESLNPFERLFSR
jgi:hypothetical protein